MNQSHQRVRCMRSGLRGTPRLAFQLSALAAALAALPAAWAQTTTAPAAPAEAAAPVKEGAVLKEVVITSERRKSSVQKTAISITAVSGEEMREKGQTNLENVLSDTPAVQVQGSPQGGQVFIRGVGANGDSNWVDPAVSLNLDSVYSGRAERVFSSMYDVSRVEVLRGPQGTLYGRNATGGSVNVLTNDPKDRFEAGVNTQLGNYSLRHADAYLNVPINDVLAVRGAVMRETRDGYFSNGGRASDLTAGRIKVLLKPTSTFSLLGTYDDFDSKGAGATTVPRFFAGGPPFFNWRTDYSDPWEVDPLHPADVQRTRFKTTSLQADWDLGFGLLTVLPAYSYSSRYVETDLVGGIAVPGSSVPLPTAIWEERQRTIEVRLASPAASPTKWVIGAYGFSSDNVQTGTPPSFPPPTWIAYGTQVPAESKALFGQITQPLSDSLRLTGGLRYTKDTKTYKYGVQSTPQSTVVGYDSGMLSVGTSSTALTYKAGVEMDLSRQSMLYAQLATGYKAGGFSTTATPPLAYEPEKLAALELGSKNRFLGNKLQVNGEIYYYSYKNYQVQYAAFGAPSPVPGDAATSFQQYVVNAGAGKNMGFEVETRYRMQPDLELRGALTYSHARYGDFAIPALSYLNGTKVASTAPWTLTLGAEKSWELGSGTLTLGGQIKFSDSYLTSLETGLPGGDFNRVQEKFHKTDLRLSYTPFDAQWTLSAWLKNLENKAQVTQVLPFGRVQVTDPRTFGINASYKF